MKILLAALGLVLSMFVSPNIDAIAGDAPTVLAKVEWPPDMGYRAVREKAYEKMKENKCFQKLQQLHSWDMGLMVSTPVEYGKKFFVVKSNKCKK